MVTRNALDRYLDTDTGVREGWSDDAILAYELGQDVVTVVKIAPMEYGVFTSTPYGTTSEAFATRRRFWSHPVAVREADGLAARIGAVRA